MNALGPVDATGGRTPCLLRYDLDRHGMVVFVADLSAVAVEMEWRHLAGRTAATALARLATATVLCGGMLEGSERLTLQVRTQGELGGLTAEVDALGNVRGYPNIKSVPELDRVPSGDAVLGIGREGFLLSVRATDERITHQGSVELKDGDVRSDALRLLGQSEQRIAHLVLAVRYQGHVRVAAGLLIEALHDLDFDAFEALRARCEGGLGERALLEASALEDVLPRLFPEAIARSAELRWTRPLRFRCRCAREKVRSMLAALPRAELEEMLRDDKGATVACHFCNDHYTFDDADLRALLAEQAGGADAG